MSADIRPLVAGHDELAPAFGPDGIAVATICDAAYIPHAAAMFASVLAHARPEDRYDLVVVTDASGASAENARLFNRWVADRPNVRIRLLDVEERVNADDLRVLPELAYPRVMYASLLLPELFRRYDRLLHISGDVVVLADVGELYRLPLPEPDLLAAPMVPLYLLEPDEYPRLNDALHRWITEIRGELGVEQFINMDTMLLDGARLRREDATARMVDLLGRYARDARYKSVYGDDTAISMACAGKMRILGPEWGEDPDHRTLFRDFTLPPKFGARVAAAGGPKAIHFVHRKPWSVAFFDGKEAYRYWEYARTTPFFDAFVRGAPPRLRRRFRRLWVKFVAFSLLSRAAYREKMMWPLRDMLKVHDFRAFLENRPPAAGRPGRS